MESGKCARGGRELHGYKVTWLNGKIEAPDRIGTGVSFLASIRVFRGTPLGTIVGGGCPSDAL